MQNKRGLFVLFGLLLMASLSWAQPITQNDIRWGRLTEFLGNFKITDTTYKQTKFGSTLTIRIKQNGGQNYVEFVCLPCDSFHFSPPLSVSGGGSGVTSFSFTNASGFTGTVTNPATTPNLTLTGSDTTSILNFGLKVRSKFSANSPITYNSATGVFGADTSRGNHSTHLTTYWYVDSLFNTGNGSVDTFSAGNLAPLFTTSVANPSTAPALSFTASSVQPHTFYGDTTNAAGVPAFVHPDTTDIVRFGIKSRALHSAASPATYNTNTGVHGVDTTRNHAGHLATQFYADSIASISGSISGSGVANQAAVFDGINSITGYNNYQYDNSTEEWMIQGHGGAGLYVAGLSGTAFGNSETGLIGAGVPFAFFNPLTSEVTISEGAGGVITLLQDTITATQLAGTGTQMVVATSTGQLRRQAISAGGVTSIDNGFGIGVSPDPIIATGVVSADTAGLSTYYWNKRDTISILATQNDLRDTSQLGGVNKITGSVFISPSVTGHGSVNIALDTANFHLSYPNWRDTISILATQNDLRDTSQHNGINSITATSPITATASGHGSVNVSSTMAASKIAGRGSAGGTGVIQAMTPGRNVSISNDTVNVGTAVLRSMAYTDSSTFYQKDYWLSATRFLGSSIRAQPITGNLSMATTSNSLDTNTQYGMCVWLPQADTITGIEIAVTNSGSATLDASRYSGLILYSVASNGAITLVDSTTRTTTFFSSIGGAGVAKKAFATPYVAQPGIYFVTLLYNVTGAVATKPVMAAFNGFVSGISTTFDLPSSIKISGILGGRNTPIASSNLSSIGGNSAFQYWYGLYK